MVTVSPRCRRTTRAIAGRGGVAERDGDVVGGVPPDSVAGEQPVDGAGGDADVVGKCADAEVPVGGEPPADESPALTVELAARSGP